MPSLILTKVFIQKLVKLAFLEVDGMWYFPLLFLKEWAFPDDSLFQWIESLYCTAFRWKIVKDFLLEKWNSDTRKWKLIFFFSRQKWKLNLIDYRWHCDGQLDTDLCQYCFKIFKMKIRKLVNWKYYVIEILSITKSD